ncbi:HAD-like domain-containing protein [Peziza echinospora]|nr:HAD-like domain-containing protein [Peziza echinospora]
MTTTTTSAPPPRTSFPPIRACLFDMDGLLLNTEDIYTTVTNLLLSKYSRPPLPWSIKAQLQGRTSLAASQILLKWANLTDTLTPQQWLEEGHVLQQQLFPHCIPLPGVLALLNALKSSPEPPYIALATSSNSKNFRLKTQRYPHVFDPQQGGFFDEDLMVMGDDERLRQGRGKPCPDIYLLALECVNKRLEERGERRVEREECLVFEDAVPGVEAGRRAGMRVVWVPHEGLRGLCGGKEGEVLAGLLGDGEEEGDDNGGDAVRFVGDGWGEVRSSLEDFDYARYGIVVKEEEEEK